MVLAVSVLKEKAMQLVDTKLVWLVPRNWVVHLGFASWSKLLGFSSHSSWLCEGASDLLVLFVSYFSLGLDFFELFKGFLELSIGF